MKTPVISGVGHETDFTLADFAADVRAPTPSAAAEMATPDHKLLREKIYGDSERILEAVASKIQMSSMKLDEIDGVLRALSPTNAIQSARQRLDHLSSISVSGIRNNIRAKRLTLEKFDHLLFSLGPDATMDRGYAIVTRVGTTEIISDPNVISKGQLLDVLVAKGKFEVEVGKTPHRSRDNE